MKAYFSEKILSYSRSLRLIWNLKPMKTTSPPQTSIAHVVQLTIDLVIYWTVNPYEITYFLSVPIIKKKLRSYLSMYLKSLIYLFSL